MNSQDTQKRVLIATLISFLFFVLYDQYFIPKPTQSQQTTTQQTQTTTNSAPNVTNTTEIGAKVENDAPKSSNAQEIIAIVELPTVTIEIDKFARINQVTFKNNYLDEDEQHVKLFGDYNILRPLEVRFADTTINSSAFKTPYVANVQKLDATKDAQELILTQTLKDITVTKKITFYPDSHYEISVKSSDSSKVFFLTPGFRPVAEVDEFVFHGALIKEFDNTITTIDDEDLDITVTFKDSKIAAASDKYYTTALYDLNNGLKRVIVDPDRDDNPLVFIEAKGEITVNGYVGAKDHKMLANINPELTSIIEYGWFTFISKPLFIALNYLYGIFGNWGWAIVVLTIIIKFILFPLTYKGMMGMQKLKDLAPKIKEIQAKHKGDPQKSSAAMMELYKKHNANPMGGCLPMLLQIPIFFAIYRVLLNAIELKGAEWILWIDDLAVMDPYFILPILMGASMFLQQHITPNTITDPMQQKIFKWLPILMTFFFITFPAGLTLYWFINNLFSVAQQYYINYLFDRKKANEISEHHK